MTSIIKALAIATALVSLATSVPMEVFKQQGTSYVTTVLECALTFFSYGTLSSNCEVAISVPGVIPSVVFNELTFDFTGLNPWTPEVSSNSITGTIISVGNFGPLSSIRIFVDVIDDKVKVGRSETDSNAASASDKTRDIRLSGIIQASFDSLIGKRTIPSLGFDVTNTFMGFDGLHDTTFLSLVSSTPDEASKKQIITFKVNIKSPSSFGLKLGDIFFSTAGPDGRIGTTTLKDVILKRGDNILTAIMAIDSSLAGAAGFVSGLETADTTVTFTGTGSSPTNAAILAAIQSLDINVVIPQKFTPKTIPGLLPATTLNQFTVDFTAANVVPLASSTEIVGSLIAISVSLPKAKIKYKVDLSFDGAVIRTVDTPYADTSATASALTTAVAPVAITIDAKAQARFAAFMKAIVTTDSVTILLEGKMDISFYLNLPFPLPSGPRVLTSIG
ncbi:hypothetical protein BGZ82_009593 [Podila clonocystis]|nr:hypothetical protein BGZ82_009593 [Podila clonocystis]